jgi:hypothetical protein
MPHAPQDPGRATIALMPSIPTILLILSLPVGAVAYVTAARILGDLPLPEGLKSFLVLFAPLFVAGLVMIPFLIPFFDRKAKADLAEHRRAMGSSADGGGDGTGAGSDDIEGDNNRPKAGPYDGDA